MHARLPFHLLFQHMILWEVSASHLTATSVAESDLAEAIDAQVLR